ncbi:MAG: hypothetical protein HYV63_07920 [Candidatus Schekmanbacteria bacterium]|nr:hypothetical protein [Candidatus Schekmanbacteria bacterium]
MRLVRAFLVSTMCSPPQRSVRYVPADEYELWMELIASRGAYHIESQRSCLWLEREALSASERASASFVREPVWRIAVAVRGAEDARHEPIVRYLPDSDYENEKAALLRHFGREEIFESVTETRGWCLLKP